jgi:hypothetical protein
LTSEDAPTDATPTDTTPSDATPSESTSASSSGTPTDSASPTAVSTSPCTPNAVTIRVLRGGSTPGQELAGISVTNTSHTACALAGPPSVQLLRDAQPLGTPARQTGMNSVIVLNSGSEAQAQVTNQTKNCSTPVSQTAAITLPNTTTPITQPMQLRACDVSVSAFAAD